MQNVILLKKLYLLYFSYITRRNTKRFSKIYNFKKVNDFIGYGGLHRPLVLVIDNNPQNVLIETSVLKTFKISKIILCHFFMS